jgi:hypothetical protein
MSCMALLHSDPKTNWVYVVWRRFACYVSMFVCMYVCMHVNAHAYAPAHMDVNQRTVKHIHM